MKNKNAKKISDLNLISGSINQFLIFLIKLMIEVKNKPNLN